ncbi:MAG TPA: cell division protein SepF [Egibacteraceae bacterium]
MWRRLGTWLGVVEEYDDDYLDLPEEEETVRPVRPGDRALSTRQEPSNVRRISPSRSDAPVTPVPTAKVHVTDPTTFNDVEEVGDKFRNGIPVIMNLAGASESVAKRLLDFASGLIYGLDGRIERVGDRVFLLTPMGVEVSSEERRRLSERGFFNQA